MSVSASVTGPAAIFGSSRRACKSAGTLNPKKPAAHRASKMPPPITPAARTAPCQSHTIKPTVVPQAAPSSAAVPASRHCQHRLLQPL